MSRWISTSIFGIMLTASLLLPNLSAADDTAVNTSANAGEWGNFEVGSRVVHIELTGTVGERRPMDVLLWYPADKQAYMSAPLLTVYKSRLSGVLLDPVRWDPLSWEVTAERAKRDVAIDRGSPAFPLIIMSHAAAGEPHNYAPTLERLASHGYVIAAPWHEGDNQDDRRIDIINQRAGNKIVQCFDGGPSPCLDGVQKALRNRARDVAAIIDTISSFFGDRVDTSRVGVLGQSRGSVTALSVAGGSTPLGIPVETRVDAIMLTNIGAANLTFSQDVHTIEIPALLVAGKIDRNTPMSISVDAFNTMPSQQKGLVVIEKAEHRSFGSAYCAQTQASGAIFQANDRAIGEQLTLENIMIGSPSAGNSLDWCFFDTFVNPVDIRPTIQTMTGFFVTETNVPRQLDSDTVMRITLELANVFFDAVLVKNAQPGVHFKQYLDPKFLLEKEGEAVSLSQIESWRGEEVACDDPTLVALDPACAD